MLWRLYAHATNSLPLRTAHRAPRTGVHAALRTAAKLLPRDYDFRLRCYHAFAGSVVGFQEEEIDTGR